jgi:hypothetical protein
MGFLDDLKGKAEEFGEKAKEGIGAAKDKAADLVGDVKDRFDNDDPSPADKVEAAAGPQPPDTVGKASYGLDDAVTESTVAAEASSVDRTEASPVDPLEPTVQTVDPVAGPAGPVDVTEDPLESAPEFQPAEPVAATEDPLEPRPDRTA